MTRIEAHACSFKTTPRQNLASASLLHAGEAGCSRDGKLLLRRRRGLGEARIAAGEQLVAQFRDEWGGRSAHECDGRGWGGWNGEGAQGRERVPLKNSLVAGQAALPPALPQAFLAPPTGSN